MRAASRHQAPDSARGSNNRVWRAASSARRRAFTMIEITVAFLVFTVVIIPAGKLALDFSNSFSSLSTAMHQSSRGLVVMDRLVHELITGDFASVTLNVPSGGGAIGFRKIVDVQDGVCLFGNPFRIELVPMEPRVDNGKDDDGDGLVDECGIRIWEDLPPHGSSPGPEDSAPVICANTTGNGLKFVRQGAVLLVEVTFQQAGALGEPPRTFTIRSGVKMRNNE